MPLKEIFKIQKDYCRVCNKLYPINILTNIKGIKTCSICQREKKHN